MQAALQNFYNEHQKIIIILTPLVLGATFILLSSVSALITINSTVIPEDFTEIKAQVENYELYELDPVSNKKKWHLYGKNAELDTREGAANIFNVQIKAYDANQLKFIMTSSRAVANEATKEIVLEGDVKVTDPKKEFILNAGTLKFSDGLDLIVDSNWDLVDPESFRISGVKGLIDKSLSSIISTGNAQITKGELNLKADKIIFKKNRPIQALGRASLKLDKQKSLKADRIIFSLNGEVKATGRVKVNTDKITCYSQSLEISPGPDGSPASARLKGSPYVIHNAKTIAADIITYDFASNEVSAQGNVHTKFVN